MKKLLLLSFAAAALLPAAGHAVLIATWTSSQAPGDLGDAGAPTVLLSPDLVATPEFTSFSTNTDYTDVVILTTTQQTQLASAGISVTQGLNNVRGATRKLTGPSIETLGNAGGGPPNVSLRDATMDLFFSPDNLNDVSQLIFETGGSGAGSSLNMNGNILTFAAAQNAATAVTTTIDVASLYGSSPNTDDMLHVRLSIDLASDTISLSAVNLATGMSANSSTTFTGTDWAGSDATGFFNNQGSTGGSAGGNVPAGYSNFDGQFAAFQFYASEVLPPVPEPSATLLGALAGALLLRRRR